MCNGFHYNITSAAIQFITIPIQRIVFYIVANTEQFIFIPNYMIVESGL